ncbi:Zn-ribbon domain-containing OB-fold protein [Nonomuraea typhae]|uniref:Zn-ribbon domain-containing OB-fold protein n=1 Tax=Nonomuraea typhae TaxID=2603600 RepID=A0ABW7YTN2_9ACTN
MPDRDAREWWERLAGGEFAVQECAACGVRRWPARAFCAHCRGEAWRWRAIEPVGTVESWVVSHRPFGDGATVVMVRLAAVAGGLVYGSWDAVREPVGGEQVRASFTDVDDAPALIAWRPYGQPI